MNGFEKSILDFFIICDIVRPFFSRMVIDEEKENCLTNFNFNQFCENLLVRVKLGHPPNFNFLGKPLLGEKYVEGRKRKKE